MRHCPGCHIDMAAIYCNCGRATVSKERLPLDVYKVLTDPKEKADTEVVK